MHDPTANDAALAAALAEADAKAAAPAVKLPVPPNERCVLEGPGLQQVAGFAAESTYFMVACFKVCIFTHMILGIF